MRRMLIGMMAAIAISGNAVDKTETATHFWLGGDISGTTEMEAHGEYSYNNIGVKTENTQLMKDYGMDMVRLRVWVDPSEHGRFCTPEDVLVMAKRAQALDMPVMIDFHYSDWWADPGKQYIPKSWADLDFEGQKKALYDHTKSTLQLLKDNNIDVRWVQVGNETTTGMMWPTADIREGKNFKEYAELTNAGYDAVKEIYPDAIAIVHLDCAQDAYRYHRVLDGLKENGAKWDMIGMSIYPYWTHYEHPELSEEQMILLTIDNIKTLKKKYGTDSMIVETGVEASKPEEGKKFIAELIDAMKHRTDGLCHGVIYWAPECDHGYPLGAFQNRRPTAIMDAFKEASEM